MNQSGGGPKEYDIFVQSNTSNLFHAYLQTYDKEDISLTSDISIDDQIINVSSGHGISANDFLIIYNSSYYWQIEVKSVASDAITLYSPAYLPFYDSDTIIIRGTADMNIDGSSTPVLYKFGIPSSSLQPIDINKALILLGHSADTGDNLFGGIAALTKGFLIRKINTSKFNFGCYRENRGFRLFGANVDPISKPPAGEYGTSIEFMLQGQENFDQVVRISYGDFITGLVQDKIDTLTFMRFSLIGSYTSGE